MIKRILESKKLFSLPEKAYKLGEGTQMLVPSLAVVRTDLKCFDKSPSIGLYLSSDTASQFNQFWEIHYLPIRAVQTYRALKLLAKCPIVEDDTLCACYYVANRTTDSTVEHYLESLKHSGFFNVEECRKYVLAEKISEPHFIQTFLAPLMETSVQICGDEIHDEVALGNIVTNIALFTKLRDKQAII